MPGSPSGAASAAASEPLHPLENEELELDQERQATAADHAPDNMSPDERAYHERFMREAINMVNHPSRPLYLPFRSKGLC